MHIYSALIGGIKSLNDMQYIRLYLASLLPPVGAITGLVKARGLAYNN